MQHYVELGVEPDATVEEIRSSYLALARRYHPDGLAGASDTDRRQASARMATVNAAWSVLSNARRRQVYDASWRGDEPRGATIRDISDSWTAFDADADDDIDPELLDDTPSGAPTLRRGFTFLPAGLGVAGAGSLIVGSLVGIGPLAGLGLVLIIAAGLSFLLVPLIALANSSRADRNW